MSNISSTPLLHQSRLLQALAHRTRIQILRIVGQRPLTVQELQRMLGVPQANVSQHLHLLRKEQVVLSQRRGKQVVYSLTHPDFIRIVDAVENIILRRLNRHAENRHRATRPALVEDPVCGMSVQPATATASLFHKGTMLYFCGRGCLHTFSKNPTHYVG